MSQNHQQYPLMYIAAFVMAAAGIAIAVAALLLQPERHLYKGLIFLAVAFLNFGGGEILNHPKQAAADRQTADQKEYTVRGRNTCGLGNLLDIVGLLMFFVAMASFIYER